MILWSLLHHFTQNQLYILTISIFNIVKKYPKIVKIKILLFSQSVQNLKQFTSVDSLSRAEQNGTNDFVTACTVVKIFTSDLIRVEDKHMYFIQEIKCLNAPSSASEKVLRAKLSTSTSVLDPSLVCTSAVVFSVGCVCVYILCVCVRLCIQLCFSVFVYSLK